MLFRSPWPNGLDGGFYAMEFRSVMERGHLENTDYSPLFWIGGALSRLLGNAVWGVKVLSALLSGFLVLGIFSLIRAAGEEKEGSACLGAALAGISPTLAVLSINYLNNLEGLVFGLFACALGLSAVRQFSWRKGMGALVLGAAAVLSHRIAAVYLLGGIGVYALRHFRIRERGGRKRPAFFLLLGGGIFIACVVTFKAADWERFAGTFSLTPVLPILSAPWRRQLPDAALWEMSFYFCLSYALLFHSLFRNRKPAVYYLAVPLFFFPFWDLSVLDMGYRLFLSSIPGGILFICLHPSIAPIRMTEKRQFLFWFSIPLFFLTIFVYQPEQDPPYGKYLRVIDTVDLGEDSLLIAHLGLNHLYTYEKGFRDALNYVPDFPIPKESLWRLAYGIPTSTFLRMFPQSESEGLFRKLPYSYVLIREDVWQEYLRREDEKIVKTLMNWYNPYKERPAFIR
jgi:hypothetical protein